VSLIELSRIPLHTDSPRQRPTPTSQSVLAYANTTNRTLHYAAVVLMNKAKESASLEILIESTFYVGCEHVKSESSSKGRIHPDWNVAHARTEWAAFQWKGCRERTDSPSCRILDQRPEAEC